jgi:UDP-N-acetylglucosamine transferase subunit ALG13
LALAASPGGHVDLLVALAPAFDSYPRTWLLPPGARLDALRAQGERTSSLRAYGQGRAGAARLLLLGNVLDALVGLLRSRPRIVVTSGAGITIPYVVLARVLGAKVVYMETMARVTSSSRTGRMLSRIAARVLVQWPENLVSYPAAKVCAPALLAPSHDPGPTERRGTVVVLGTHWQPFTRLLKMVEEAAVAGVLPRPVTAQVGDHPFPSDVIETVSVLPPQRVDELIRQSEVVICHGGAGIIATTLRAGRWPLVLPRRRDQAEHVDDHQYEIVDKLAALGLLTRLNGAITAEDVAAASTSNEGRLPLPGDEMVAVLRQVLEAL